MFDDELEASIEKAKTQLDEEEKLEEQKEEIAKKEHEMKILE